ncbi:hypothetical protein FRUB_07598 [Fimbriiglobus ruber]|uniref:Pyrrolo-quinoline quinone repeat domain-containing protein n=1 Tax=Fimbriiglobus ruber TaxID=1908690 RepID=A0A225DIS8_9BACT|nr:hypothetical protein FRUB_07598 [Fimbriiglobus ruber]
MWKETGVIEHFPANGPKKLWSVPIRGGYSGPAVVGGLVYVTDYARADGDATNNPAKRGELTGKERVLCLDAKTGQKVWKHEYDCTYSVSYPTGPRCTPTVAGGNVYALGAMGNLVCLTAADGKLVWARDFKKDYNTGAPMWGFCGHPLVYKNLVICIVGGDGTVAVAFDKDTGVERWRALSAPEPGYCAPTLIEAGGTKQLVIWHAKSINGLDPDTGKKYWSVPLEPKYGMAIMAPLKIGDYLFAGGIGHQAVLLKLDPNRPDVSVVWHGRQGTAIYPVNSPPVADGDTIYGVDQPGQLRAVRVSTGERLWSTFKPILGEAKDDDYAGAGSGTAFLVKHGDRYFLFGETGHLIIARLTPERYEEIGRAKLVEPTGDAMGRKVVWSYPAFANKCVYVRNDKEIACYSLAKE